LVVVHRNEVGVFDQKGGHMELMENLSDNLVDIV
jgi:hypothetical protein